MTTHDQPRLAALELLRLVRDDGAYANLALAQVLRKFALHGRDAAFTVELAYGVLRNQMLYDQYIQDCANREVSAIEPEVLDVLRMGVHQVVAMRVPDHAAVDSTVQLIREKSSPGQAQARAGFVNAILHCLIRARDAGLPEPTDLSLRYSHPQWIVDSYREALDSHGRTTAEVAELMTSNNEPAKPVLAVRSGELAIEGTVPGQWSPVARVVDSVIPSDLIAGKSLDLIVQDEGSQLVAQAFLLAQPQGREAAWLDMCAGPGGKAALISDSVPEGVSFTAVELHEHRATLVLNIVQPDTRVLIGDSRNRPWGNIFFDRVLVDAPCTGLGALRRRPEARWRKSESDLRDLNPLQEELLMAAIDSTRSGGVICYVTCSPHVDETQGILGSVLEQRSDVALEDARPLFPGVSDLGSGPTVQLWPHVHGTDAMFFALLRRR